MTNTSSFSAEKLLQASEAISMTGSWYYHLQTHEQIWSAQHYKIFEIEEPQHSDKLFELYRERIHPEDLIVLDQYLYRAKHFGENFIFDHRVLLDNGARIKYVRGTGKVSFDENGKPEYVTGTCQDRTTEIENEIKFEALLNTMSEGLTVFDSDMKVMNYNSSALKILRCSKEEIINFDLKTVPWIPIRPNGEVIQRSEMPSFIALTTGTPVDNATIGLKFPDQEPIWLTVNATPFMKSGKRHVILSFYDISRIVRAHEENKFILESLNIGIWKANLITGEQSWDDSLYKLYELERTDLKRDYETWLSYHTEESRKKVEEGMRDIEKGATEFTVTYEIVTQNGNRKFIGGKGKVLKDSQNRPYSLHGINWDKTNEVELEQKLALEREKNLHQAKLATIGQLAAGVGHEINNPLAIISGNISISKSTLKSPEIDRKGLEDRFTKMDVAVQRIANIVQGLRIYARSDINQLTQFNVHDLVTETVDMLKGIYSSNSVKLFVTGTKNSSVIFGNRGKIQQALINIISNAYDATEKQLERMIEVRIIYLGFNVQISIKDNGPGIPPHIIDKVFEPFFTTKEINKGTGLGLSLVESIIKEHLGSINLKTSSESGTEFTLTLPLKTQAHADVVAPVEVVVPEAILKSKILLVDDEEDIREGLAYILKNDYVVTCAANAEEALKHLGNSQYDLVVTDIKMPGKSGIDLLTEHNSKGLPTKFLFISGTVELPKEQQELIDNRSFGILYKPFSENGLKLEIKKVLERK